MTTINNKHVLITGGASGLGRLLALRCAGLGATVTLWDVNAAGAERKTGRIIAGVLFLIAGLALIFIPEQSVKTVAVIVGLSFILWGVIMAIAAFVRP